MGVTAHGCQIDFIKDVQQKPTVAKPLEEQVQTSGGLVAHPKTFGTIGSIFTVANVVLEQALGTVVGETLCELDHGDEVGRGGKILANTA